MRLKRLLSTVGLVVGGLGCVTAFQNCSDTKFSSNSSQNSDGASVNSPDIPGTPAAPAAPANDGTVPANKPVQITCYVDAALDQSLLVTLENGQTRNYLIGHSGSVVGPFTVTFDSKPANFQAYTARGFSLARYSPTSNNSIMFQSEDGDDSDFNDLICAMTW